MVFWSYMVMPVIAYGKIKPLRQAKGLNQSEMAAELGVSRPTYVLMEQGEKEPTLSQLYTLARLLNVEPGELCTNLPSLATDATNEAKFKDLVSACILQGSESGSITKTKLSILAYLSDFVWYRLHGKPMTGASYRCGARGPVADPFFRIIDELYEEQAVAIEPQGTAMVLRAIEQRPTKLLSQEELSLIYDICTKWRLESTEALQDFVRRQAPCKNATPGHPLPYETILNEPPTSLY